MKLPITDKFLWEIYIATHRASEILNFMLNPRSIKFMPGPRDPIFVKYRREKGAKEFAKFIYYLKTRNYIRIENLKGKKTIIITKQGINKALRASFRVEDKKKRKDGKWIMLSFDMPARNKKSRDLMRSILYNLGYKMFQQSLWITPYDVSEKTEKLLQMHSLDKYVKIFLIEEI